jgi:hypothetical protein
MSFMFTELSCIFIMVNFLTFFLVRTKSLAINRTTSCERGI